MRKFLGIDMGSNSLGLTVRNNDTNISTKEQLEYFSSIIFKSGVGNGKSGEFSYAAERTKHRSPRRLYQARKYRIWETLKVLIEFGFCPMKIEELEKWSKYDKAKGLKREYPVNAIQFEQWVRLDFNGDGVSDYSSPYQLRAELATNQLDFSIETDRYKLGRALYHIAQRRGFKSSKGETIKEQEKTETQNDKQQEINLSEELKKSEQNKSKDLVEYIEKHGLKTVGCAFAKLENEGIRVRASEFQAVRAQYKEEILKIFEFQNTLDLESEFFKRIFNEKKGVGTIFYKRPLRSQKGLIGECTLEPNKSRCPISHPEFEEFRAWCFINNIKYRRTNADVWLSLNKEQKQKLLIDKFQRTLSNFKFEEIRIWLEKIVEFPLINTKNEKLINYKDKTSVSGCPITGRLKNLFGDNWQSFSFQTTKTRKNLKTGIEHPVTYNYEDIWHICFSFDDTEQVEEFAKSNLDFTNDKVRELVRIWGTIQQGYAQLSLKAIRNINRFLKEGLIYSEAALLAKLPEILGADLWKENQNIFLNEIRVLTTKNREEKRIFNIVNNLIANYKSIDESEKFAFKNKEYKLENSDTKEIQDFIKENFGEKTWNQLLQTEKDKVLVSVSTLYQQFFASSNRDFYSLPKLEDSIKSFLTDHFDFLNCTNKKRETICDCDACKKLNKLYHPSMIEFYKPAREQEISYDGVVLSKKLLESPVIGSLKNPMVMRAMHILRKQINSLLLDGIIDEDTRIIVETARDLNDANQRWAIEAYQREREKENKEFTKAIQELFQTDREISNDDLDKARLLIEQHNNPVLAGNYKKNVDKYRLWFEQGCQCIYTGELINISKLFSENGGVDFEHTIPRSISFDDSFANLTVCDAFYNRQIKKNQIPTQLPNYDKDYNFNGKTYTAILPRLDHWKEKVEALKDNVDFWKARSKRAQDKEIKDDAIRQRHLWQMELDYWKNKVERFTMEEVTSGFRNSQLVDTRIITKYAYHYLKSVFNNVDVQKGSVTANFRKMLGVQSIEEKKSRDKHSHHAIDAAILTLIPTSAKRDKMLEIFYKIDEAKKLNRDTISLQEELNKEKRSCNLSGNISEIVTTIEDTILINHISKDQTLTPAKRKARKRGKELFVENSNGVMVTKWITGDCIRGQLHKDSLFGAIKYPTIDETGNPIIEDNKFVYPTDKDGKEIIIMVKNVLIKDFKDDKDLESIVDPKARVSIQVAIGKRKMDGKSFATAIAEPIWMLDKNNDEKRIDRNGKLLCPIRHVRCKVKAGKGFFTKEKAIEIKEQTYKSKKQLVNLPNRDYKQFFYAQNDGNYLCLLYENINEEKVERKFKFINYFEIAKLKLNNSNDLWNEPFFQKIEDKKLTYNLTTIIKTGTRVLIWENSPDELRDLLETELYKRLFYVIKFNSVGIDYIYLQNHIEAREDNLIGQPETFFDSNKYQSRIMLTSKKFNCLVEGRDFRITTNGKIEIQ